MDMKEENRKSLEIEDWIKELLPDYAADIGIGAVIHNQLYKGIAAMTSTNNSNDNNNTSMWQHQLSDNQRMETMASNFRQPQSLQNQSVAQVPEKQNIFQFPMQSNPYASNLRHWQVQASPACHPNQTSMLNKGLEMQSGSVSEPARPELLHRSFYQAHNVMWADQTKPAGNQAKTVRHGFVPLQALSESTPRPQLTNSTEWMDHAYYKVLQMKEMFSPNLLALYKRSQELRQSANNVETLNKCEKIKMNVERVMTFLSMSRSDISRWRKDKLLETMNDVVKFANQAKASNDHAQKQNQLIVEPNNSVCLQNIIKFNYSQPPSFKYNPNAAHPTNPARLITSVSPTLNNKQPNNQTMKRQRSNKQKNPRHFGGLINQMRPPLYTGGVANSPQNLTQSSSGINLNYLSSPLSSSKFSNSATASVSASSCAFPSPLTPLTPCSNPSDFTKSPLSIDESCKFLPNSDPTLRQGAFGSGANTECAEKQSSRDEKVDPVKRLVDTVTSMSPRNLNSAIQDMSDVISLADRIATHDDSTKVMFQDLADDISKFRMPTETKDRMEIETRYCGIASARRLAKEPSDVLFQEINEVNQRFLEVKIDVMSTDDVSRIGFDDGILIRCSYVPVGPASQQMIHKLLLELIVPVDYPAFSPTVSEEMSRGCGDSEEGKYMWKKAKSDFGIKLRSLSQPITVKQMARAWEASARDVFVEYAQQMGGGSFSSRYYGMKMSGPGYSLCC